MPMLKSMFYMMFGVAWKSTLTGLAVAVMNAAVAYMSGQGAMWPYVASAAMALFSRFVRFPSETTKPPLGS